MPCPRASCRIIFVIHVSSYSPTSRSIALRRCACSLSTVPVCAAVADQSAGFATARCCRAYPTTNSILAFKPPIWFSQHSLREPDRGHHFGLPLPSTFRVSAIRSAEASAIASIAGSVAAAVDAAAQPGLLDRDWVLPDRVPYPLPD